MNIYIMSFAKDKNSTKQPTLTGLTPISVELKRDTSIMFPVFRVQESNYAVNYNYIYVQEWNRYYYIDNAIITMGGIWELACTEDCLASWKTDIGAGTYYILRSSVVYNTDIVDDYYPAFGNAQSETLFGTNLFSNDLTNGYYVIGIISRAAYADAAGMGAVAYYVMNSGHFREFLNSLMSSSGWLNVPNDVSQGGMSSELLKALYNPFQYVVSCKWFPFKPPTNGSLGGQIPYGWWNLTVDADAQGISAWKLASTPVYEVDSYIPVNQHPQAATRGQYLNCHPFRTLEFIAGPFGVIPIDANVVGTSSKIGFTVRCDCISGEATLIISPDTPVGGTGANYNHIFPVHHANMGVDIQIAQIALDRLNQTETALQNDLAIARGVLNVGGTALSASNIVNPLTGVTDTLAAGVDLKSTYLHSIADGLRASVPSLQVSGSQGSIAGYSQAPMLTETYYRIVDDDNAEVGRPYCATGSPTNIGNGFYMMKRGEVNCNANSVEKNIIASYLIGGFKYE